MIFILQLYCFCTSSMRSNNCSSKSVEFLEREVGKKTDIIENVYPFMLTILSFVKVLLVDEEPPLEEVLLVFPVLDVWFPVLFLEVVPEPEPADSVPSELAVLPSELTSAPDSSVIPDSSGFVESPLACVPAPERLLFPPLFDEHDAKLRHNKAKTTVNDRNFSHDLLLRFIKQSLSFLK